MDDVWEDLEEKHYESSQRDREWKQLQSTHAVVSLLGICFTSIHLYFCKSTVTTQEWIQRGHSSGKE
jgi:hypothetical protein